MARDSYSYLHLPMVAGIVLVALGLKKTLGHVDDPLELVPAFALLGGWRSTCSPTSPSATATFTRSTASASLLAILLLALVPVAAELPALASLAIANALIWAMIVYETRKYGEGRHRVRRPEAVEHSSA